MWTTFLTSMGTSSLSGISAGASTYWSTILRSAERLCASAGAPAGSPVRRHGRKRAWFERHPDAARPRPDPGEPFAPKRAFVPQRSRAIYKLKAIAIVLGGAGLLLGSAVVMTLLG